MLATTVTSGTCDKMTVPVCVVYFVSLFVCVQFLLYDVFSLQCFDTVGWVTGRSSRLYKVGCWFVGGDDLTGALHALQLQLSPPKSSQIKAHL